MLNRLNIGPRLMLLVLPLIAAMIAVGAVGIEGMHLIDASLDTVYQDRVVCLRDLKTVSDAYLVEINGIAWREAEGHGEAQSIATRLEAARTRSEAAWKSYTATYLVPREAELVRELAPLFAAADRRIAELPDLLRTAPRDVVRDRLVRDLLPALDALAEPLNALIQLQLDVAKDEYVASQALYRRMQILAIGLIALAAAGGLGLGLAIARSITRPVGRVRDALRRMAGGDLEVLLAVDPGSDETADMTRAASAIIRTIQAVEADLREVTEAARSGSLSVRADAGAHPGRFGELSQGVNDLADQLARPLHEVAAVMAQLAGGNVKGRVAGDYEGELRALKGNVNRSLETIDAMVAEIDRFARRLAEGDMTCRIEGGWQGAFASIQADLNRAGAELRGLTREVAVSTAEVSSAAEQTTIAVADVSRKTAGQIEALGDVATAMTQSTAAVAEIAGSAQRGAVLAREAMQAAVAGRERLEHLTRTVDAIAAGNARIDQVSKLIAGIADKTYVLALNAGLEALRAGEHGQGFGLIAAQIGRLAEDVGRATQQIGDGLDEAGRLVQGGVASAEAAGKAIALIVAAVEQSSEAVQTIAAGIEEQNAAIRLVSERVGGLMQAGQGTASASEQIAATMLSLSGMAGQLRGRVERIRVA